MTNKEAIVQIKAMTPLLLACGSKCTSEMEEAQQLAISALSESEHLKTLNELFKDELFKLSKQLAQWRSTRNEMTNHFIIEIDYADIIKNDGDLIDILLIQIKKELAERQ